MADLLKMKFNTVEEYLSAIPESQVEMIDALRKIILQAAPKATEKISYNMPGFELNGMLVWYASCKGHIGFYPSNAPIEVFKEELKAYKTTKGSIHLPLDKPLPVALIKKIVKYRIAANKEKQAQRS